MPEHSQGENSYVNHVLYSIPILSPFFFTIPVCLLLKFVGFFIYLYYLVHWTTAILMYEQSNQAFGESQLLDRSVLAAGG